MITLDKVSKIFSEETAVDTVSMEVPEGNVCVLLGPSGCGKTTTMRMINRLIEPTSGRIVVNGRDNREMDEVTLRRSIGYVIQQIGLFPNKTVEENISIVPRMLGWDRKTAHARAAELLDLVNLDPDTFLSRYPKELSGGQAQRVGVIRALAADPPILLMDEPFGAIDPINREVIQDQFLELQAKLKKTIVFVSHDVDEAVKMADRVAIMRAGKLIQYDAPDDILARPCDAFVADFVGADRTLKRLRLIQVEDVMMKDPPTVRAEDRLDRAVGLMEENEHISIVMVGAQGRARGIVRRASVSGRQGNVGENIEKIPGVVHPDDDLRTAVSQMFTHDQTWLAVVDREGFYKGYITQRAITHTLGAIYRKE